jgi:hypothetical protein
MQCVISHNRGRRAGLHHSPGDAKHGALAWPTVDKVPCEDDRARRVCSSQVPRSPLTVGLGFKRHRADRQRRFDRSLPVGSWEALGRYFCRLALKGIPL